MLSTYACKNMALMQCNQGKEEKENNWLLLHFQCKADCLSFLKGRIPVSFTQDLYSVVLIATFQMELRYWGKFL